MSFEEINSAQIEMTLCTISKCKDTITAFEEQLVKDSDLIRKEVEIQKVKNQFLKASIMTVSADIRDSLERMKCLANTRHDDIFRTFGKYDSVQPRFETDIFGISPADSECFNDIVTNFANVRRCCDANVDYKTLHFRKEKKVPLNSGHELILVAAHQNVIAVATSGSFLYILSTRNDEVNQILLGDERDRITNVEFISTEQVTVAFSTGCVQIIDLPQGNVVIEYRYPSRIIGLKVHPSTKYFIAATSSEWDLFSLGARKSIRKTTVEGGITSIDIHQSGKYAATTNGSLIQLWNLGMKECISTIPTRDVEITSLHFCMHGNWLIAGMKNGVCLINIKNGEERIQSQWIEKTLVDSPPITTTDITGTLVVNFQGKNMRLLATNHIVDESRKYEIYEVMNLNQIENIIHAVVHMEGLKPEIWALKDKSLRLYTFM